MTNVRVHQEGPEVLLVIDGRALKMPWNVALDVSKALQIKARKAEEIAKAEGIIFDQALLIRTGAPLGFTDNPDIQKEAAKEAAHNGDLRKYLPGGVKATEQFGNPTVRHNAERNGHGKGS